jgi:fructose-1,6-bisphosphatase I
LNSIGADLSEVLESYAARHGAQGKDLSRVIEAIAESAAHLAKVIAAPASDAELGAKVGSDNSDGDQQRKLDLVAEEICRAALKAAGVGPYLSEETEGPLTLNPGGALAVAIDPLDGSSNIEVNGIIGAIFGVLPATRASQADPALAFTQPGRAQLAAGFVMFGPQTRLVLTLGEGVDVYGLNPATGRFQLAQTRLSIPRDGAEYAINASNHRHWREPVRRYVDDCLKGVDGSRGANFNMRWAGALVADAFRIFTRGGVFLYPADSRRGYENGRLRLVYEANPMAMLTEQAGGAAIDGLRPILDIIPERPHQRAPLIMGAAEEVEVIRRLHLIPAAGSDAPLRTRATV